MNNNKQQQQQETKTSIQGHYRFTKRRKNIILLCAAYKCFYRM